MPAVCKTSLPVIRAEKEKSKSNKKTLGNEKLDDYRLSVRFEMDRMTAKLSRLGGREYRGARLSSPR